jgi:transposase
MKLKVFIQSLRDKYPFDDICLIMDNLNIHKGAELRALYDELGFMYTFTPVYSPQFNGIEEVINMGKKIVKDKRLELILTNK